jgi:poly(3-hydroxybutyrate) depolymerase
VPCINGLFTDLVCNAEGNRVLFPHRNKLVITLLYSIYEANQAFLAPFRMFTEATRSMARHPFQPMSYVPFGSMLEAGAAVLDNVIRKRGKPAWGISQATVDGEAVDVSIERVLRQPFGDLVRFRKIGVADSLQPKLLIVAPMSGHYATLLRGTVLGLLNEHDVYITDWHDAAEVPFGKGRFGIDNYIDYLLAFLRQLGPGTNVVAVCQPAPLVIAATAILAEAGDASTPATMTLMGGPVDTRAAPTVPTELADKRSLSWFRSNCIATVPASYGGAGRQVYPGFLQLGAFIAMNPDRHLNAHMRMFRHLVEGDGESASAQRRFYDEYLSVMDVPADYYLETIRRVFKEHWLPRGKFVWHGHQVCPEAIESTALLTIEGELDDISAPGQTIAAHEICSGIPAGRQRDLLQQGVGHYGIFNGRRWRENIAPEIGRFIREMG